MENFSLRTNEIKIGVAVEGDAFFSSFHCHAYVLLDVNVGGWVALIVWTVQM